VVMMKKIIPTVPTKVNLQGVVKTTPMSVLDHITISKRYDSEEQMLFISPRRQIFCIENAFNIAKK